MGPVCDGFLLDYFKDCEAEQGAYHFMHYEVGGWLWSCRCLPTHAVCRIVQDSDANEPAYVFKMDVSDTTARLLEATAQPIEATRKASRAATSNVSKVKFPPHTSAHRHHAHSIGPNMDALHPS